jgi:SpoVK/Ycf46/Vps4 family AAA+-type ATPase
MIGTMKCAEFNKFMDYYKKKTHLSFYDYQNFMFATSAQQFYPSNLKVNVSQLYEEWQNEHEVLNMDINMQDINTHDINMQDINTPEKSLTKNFVTIDFSLNSISDLIQIAEENPFQEDVEYNINLKTIHSIKPELCELNAMIGMHTLKKSVLEQLLYYLQGLHNGADDYKHTVIFGPPGTGKTEVAKVLGAIYSKIGVINKPCDPLGSQPKSTTEHKFKKATRSDMIAGYLGQTAIKMKALITQSLGGVLFIDEAYSLGDDNFSKECVDTLCESLSDQKDNIMVIIAGYENELNERFFSLNSGLESRFVWRFKIDNYSAKDLWEIFKKKVADYKWKIGNVDGEKWFKKRYDSFSGFGRDIETLLFKAKIAHSKRVYGKADSEKRIIELADLEIGYEIFMKSKENTREYSLKKSQKIISTMFA